MLISGFLAQQAIEKRYNHGRKIDKKDVYRRIFKGNDMRHEEMFATRGYRGLNILPFPDHIKQMIKEGVISLEEARKFGRYEDGKYDYSDYEKINAEAGKYEAARRSDYDSDGSMPQAVQSQPEISPVNDNKLESIKEFPEPKKSSRFSNHNDRRHSKKDVVL